MRIAQITDPHLQADRRACVRGVEVLRQLDRVMRDVSRCAPDLVVCTGDIADDLSDEAYVHFKECMSQFGFRWVCVPGNHDSRSGMRRHLPGLHGSDEAPVQFAEHLDDLLLLGLDSSAPGCVEGHLDLERVDWVRRVLEGEKAKGVVVFLHHPPVRTSSAWMDQIVLKNPELLAEALRGVNALAIFCGHTHFEHQGGLAGIPVYVTPATSFQFSRREPVVESTRPAWREIVIDGTGVRTQVHWLD